MSHLFIGVFCPEKFYHDQLRTQHETEDIMPNEFEYVRDVLPQSVVLDIMEVDYTRDGNIDQLKVVRTGSNEAELRLYFGDEDSAIEFRVIADIVVIMSGNAQIMSVSSLDKTRRVISIKHTNLDKNQVLQYIVDDGVYIERYRSFKEFKAVYPN